MLLALLIVLSASADGGADAGAAVEPTAIAPADLHPRCAPPGSWDPVSKQCKAGCGIPISWENGVQIGGCGPDRNGALEVNRPLCKPPKTWNASRKRCELEAADKRP